MDCPTMAEIEALHAAMRAARPVLPESREKPLRALIEAAFPVEPVPDASGAVVCPHEKHRGEAQRLFAGKRWTEIPVADLKAEWSLHVWLSPGAFEYYLPAFLLSSLGAESTRDFLRGVLFLLRPNWRALDQGSPQAFTEFCEGSSRAVAAYLETFLDGADQISWRGEPEGHASIVERQRRSTSRYFQWQAAQDLLWRWNRFETPGLAKARAWDARMRDAELALPEEPAARAVAEAILLGFSATPAPDPRDMSDSWQGEEPYECSVQFRGRDWRRLSREFLGWNQEALSFFSDAAFRYFIPAFMIADLSREGIGAVDHLTHGLVAGDCKPGDQYDWAARARCRFDEFSPRERAAVVAYLERAAAADEYERPRIEEALSSYWRRT